MTLDTSSSELLSNLQAGGHVAQLFASTDCMARVVVSFARDGLDRGDGVILFVSREHRDPVVQRMQLEGLNPDQIEPGRLVLEDAEQMLSHLVTDADEVDEDTLRQTFKKLIQQLHPDCRETIRLYGEVVLLLHLSDRPAAAQRLEAAWNRICDEFPITVLCGFMDFGPAGRPMPAELAELHQHVYRDSSRERLMQSARALFVDGYHKTSTAAVARYAASSESQMVKHFGSKEGLLHAVFDLWWDDLLERINGGSGFSELPPRLRLDRVIDCMVDQFRFDQKVGRLMLLEGWRFQTAGEGPIMTEGFLRFRRILDDALKEASERGQLTSGVSPDIVRDALVGAAEGLVRNLLTAEYSEEEVVYSFDKVREILNTLTDSLVAPGSA